MCSCHVQHHVDGKELDVIYSPKKGRRDKNLQRFSIPSCLPVDRQKLCVAYRLSGGQWHRSFINEVHPNLIDALSALPAWLTATGEYRGVKIGDVYYPTRGETFEYDVVKCIDAVCVDWHSYYCEELGHEVYQSLTAAEIALIYRDWET